MTQDRLIKEFREWIKKKTDILQRRTETEIALIFLKEKGLL